MNRLCFVLTWVVVVSIAPEVPAAIQGRVYLDRNSNGKPDADEPGIASVLVSDGVHVAVTDASGKYSLAAGPEPTLLAVTVPRNHAAPHGYWRWSDGTHEEDFALAPKAQPDQFCFIQITDTHGVGAGKLEQFFQRVNRFPRPIAFVVNTGDLTTGVDTLPPEQAPKAFEQYHQATAVLRVPLWDLPGNHEHVSHNVKGSDPKHPYYGKGLYRQQFGPTYYSWDWGPVHCVALDGTSLPYQEKLGDGQRAWLTADLGFQPPDKPILLFCHQPLHQLRDAKELAGVLHGHRVLAAFCGHWHSTFTAELAGIPIYLTGAMCGAWWSGPNPDGTPQGFRLVQFDGQSVKTEYFNREGRDSVAVVEPLAKAALSGRVEFKATLLDFGGSVELAARFQGRRVGVELDHREPLWSTWKGTIDTREVYDGVRALKLAAQMGNEMSWTETRYLVVNHHPEPFQTDAPAVLKLAVRAIDAADEVLLNGVPLGTIPATTSANTVLQFPIPATRLTRLNRVTIRAVPQRGRDLDDFSVGPLSLEYRGAKIYDLRYPSFERHLIGDADAARCKPERDFYFCLP